MNSVVSLNTKNQHIFLFDRIQFMKTGDNLNTDTSPYEVNEFSLYWENRVCFKTTSSISEHSLAEAELIGKMDVPGC